MPQYNSLNDIMLEEFSIDGFSTDDNDSIISQNTSSSIKIKTDICHKQVLKHDYKSQYTDDQDTFCIDMSRYRNFTSANYNNTLSKTNYHIFNSSMKMKSLTAPVRFQRNRKSRSNQVYKSHKHHKNVTVTLIPCKGPACQSQICCAQYCSIKCYTNQMRPLGTGFMKTSTKDYESVFHQEIDVTDYGLPYPDHTYCRDHKNIYFTPDSNIDSPPYCNFVEELFYDEKEMRIKNPRPEPNVNGDPISSNGYVNQIVRRGRPKRSTVIGLLDPYIFHPSTDVVYTPFLFKECILQADRVCSQTGSQKLIKQAIRKSSNLYKDVRGDIPKEIIHGIHYSSRNNSSEVFDKEKHSLKTRTDSIMIDHIFDCDFSLP